MFSTQDDRTRIIGKLYDGILSDDDWYDGLDGFRVLLGGDFFHHISQDQATGLLLENLPSNNCPMDVADTYLNEYYAGDERVDVVMRMKPGEVMFDHEHLGPALMASSRIYNEWLRPRNVDHSLVAIFEQNSSTNQYMAVLRGKGCGGFTDKAQKEMAQCLMPDMSRAARLRRQTREIARLAAVGETILSSLPFAAFIADAQGKLHYHTHTLAQLIQTQPGVSLHITGLQFDTPAIQVHYRQLLQAACQPLGARAGVLQASPQAFGPSLTILPISSQHRLSALTARPLALCLWSTPRTQAIQAELLAEWLDLTRAESRLASQLATGMSLQQYADTTSISLHTAQSHLKSIMAKCGCSRQQDLMRLLHSVPLP